MPLSLENPLAYCREKVGGELSSLHYATLFQTEEFKAFWLGCFTLNHELRQACLKQLEAGLTQVKLGWWRNALCGAGGNSNPHPVITAISAKLIAQVNADNWATLINSVASACEPKRYNSMADWRRDVHGGLEPWLPLVKARMGEPDADCAWLLVFWGEATRLCQLLRLAKYLDQGFQPVPIELLSSHGVSADQLKRRQHDQATCTLFQQLGDELVSQAEMAWNTMPQGQRLFARPLRALYRMRVAEWRAHQKAGLLLLSEQKIISPFKKFSTAWTTQVLRR